MFEGSNFISGNLFPTKWSFFIFISYMALFINQGLLVTATKTSSNSYNYNVTTVVLFTEILKLLVSVVAFLREKSIVEMFKEITSNKRVLLLYMVPAFMYCLYNNLAFINLAAFDPTTYFLLLQFRVVITGIVFQVLFSKKLSSKQWFSLILLTVGCIIKQFHSRSSNSSDASSTASTFLPYFNINFVFLLVQIFCSCFAGVYNEYLLKGVGLNIHIMIQNIFMYIDSIICNITILLLSGQLLSAFTLDAMSSVLKYKIIFIMINNACIGIITSLFLKNLNSILKTFASALELMFTAVLSWIIFGIAIDIYTVVAIVIVSGATIIYSQNPVVNPPKHENAEASTETSSKSIQSV